MQRHFLSQKELKAVIEKVKQKYNIDINPEKAEIGKEKKQIFFFFDGKLSLFSEELIPTLCLIESLKLDLPYVEVDEGAVRAILKGADLFVPGIKSFHCENSKPGDIILVKTTAERPIAVMKMLITVEEALSTKKGKFAQSLHFLGDEIWKMCR
ncbi:MULTISPECIES: DUF1947 domain-containing protein [Acidianus]|uniref:RNA-binding protein n=1 Tax=Candidatus Acidianus copahuensis TaxID=1160895 RepID=A0A031LUP2_9CREN|nr:MULTISPECIES: DUF1947 domain-containing protein [Acidianus]EZQ10868.1 RNA-binding protein [Candidatus Acidianus copahuensis]NON62015.1 DUF1947 domain-containing protein [Acidianus sp. RZ1]